MVGPLFAAESAPSVSIDRTSHAQAILTLEPAIEKGGDANAAASTVGVGDAPMVLQVTQLVEFLSVELQCGKRDGGRLDDSDDSSGGLAAERRTMDTEMRGGGGGRALLRWLGQQLWDQIERGIVTRLGPVEPAPTAADLEQTAKLAAFETKLRLWFDEKVAQFDAGGPNAKKHLARYGSRSGYIANLQQQVLFIYWLKSRIQHAPPQFESKSVGSPSQACAWVNEKMVGFVHR